MVHSVLRSAAVTAGLSVMPAAAVAAVVAYEGFAGYTGATLAQQSGTGNTGFATAWRGNPVGAATDSNVDLNTAASLASPAFGPATAGGHASEPASAGAYRTLSTPLALGVDKDYYLSFLIRNTAGAAGEFAGVSFFRNPTPTTAAERFFVGTNEASGNLKFGLGLQSTDGFTSANLKKSTANFDTAQTYFYVAKLSAKATANDQAFLKAYAQNDTVDAADPAAWTLTSDALNLSFDLTTLGINGNNGYAVDEVRVGESWADVTAVPEPAAASAVLAAAAGALLARRRR